METKANDGSGNNEGRDTWETPQELWNKLNNQYRFTFDCCSSNDNSKCNVWSTDFLNYDSDFKHDLSWMNPPFSKALEMFTHFFKVINKGVAIYRCDNMETKLWQEIIFPKASWIFIPLGRICYEGMEGKGSRFPSALIGFNVKPPIGIKGGLLS